MTPLLQCGRVGALFVPPRSLMCLKIWQRFWIVSSISVLADGFSQFSTSTLKKPSEFEVFEVCLPSVFWADQVRTEKVDNPRGYLLKSNKT